MRYNLTVSEEVSEQIKQEAKKSNITDLDLVRKTLNDKFGNGLKISNTEYQQIKFKNLTGILFSSGSSLGDKDEENKDESVVASLEKLQPSERVFIGTYKLSHVPVSLNRDKFELDKITEIPHVLKWCFNLHALRKTSNFLINATAKIFAAIQLDCGDYLVSCFDSRDKSQGIFPVDFHSITDAALKLKPIRTMILDRKILNDFFEEVIVLNYEKFLPN
jgi:hypothetical protein